jgi:sugar phosphate isomerase/epimerase
VDSTSHVSTGRTPGPTPIVATICFDGFDDRDFVDTFALAPELGIVGVEFNCWYPRTLTPATLRGLVARSADAGLAPATLQVITPPPSSGFGGESGDVARWLWMLEAASILGVDLVKSTGPKRSDDPAMLERLVAIFRHVAPIAKELGIRIAVENHFDNAYEFAGDYDVLFEDLPAEIGMCLDTGHFAASGVDMHAIIDRFGSRLLQIDLKDCAGSGAADFVPFGLGIVDFEGVLTHAVEAGFDGYIVVEYPRPAGADVSLDILQAGKRIAEGPLRSASAG